MKDPKAEIEARGSEGAAVVRILATFLEAFSMGLALIGTAFMASKGLLTPYGTFAAVAVLGMHVLGRLGLYALAEGRFKVSTATRKH